MVSVASLDDKLKEALIKCLRGVVFVCLEVGTAHGTPWKTPFTNDNALIIYAVRFIQLAPVGGAHL